MLRQAQHDVLKWQKNSSKLLNTKFADHNWRVLEALRPVAAELGRPLAQVALAWAAAQPGISSLIVGASQVAQLHDSLASLEIKLSSEQVQALDDASILDPFQDRVWPMLKRAVFGGGSMRGWQ